MFMPGQKLLPIQSDLLTDYTDENFNSQELIILCSKHLNKLIPEVEKELHKKRNPHLKKIHLELIDFRDINARYSE